MSDYRKADMINDILYQRDESRYSQAWEGTQQLIRSNFFGCYFYEGELYARANLNDEAIRSFEQALVSKNPIWIWRDLGIYFATGKYVRKDIEKANICLKNIKKIMKCIYRSNPEKVLKARNAYRGLKSKIKQSSPTTGQNIQIRPSPVPSSELLQQMWF